MQTRESSSRDVNWKELEQKRECAEDRGSHDGHHGIDAAKQKHQLTETRRTTFPSSPFST